MRGIVSRPTALTILAVAAFLFSLGGTATAQTLTIMHTNDMHSHLLGYGPNGEYTPLSTGDDGTVGGLARIAGKVKDVRADRPADSTLLVDGGDFMMGSAFVFLGGAAELQVMDAMGYDVATLGNHEFDWTSDGTAAILSQMPASPNGFPIVASNLVFDPVDPGDDLLKAVYDSGLIQDTIVKTVGSIDVGFFGLMGDNAASVAPLAHPVTFRDRAAAAADAVAALQTAGVDLIVCLSHSGLDEDSALAGAVSGIDVIISGHTHETTDTGPITVGTTLIVQAGGYTRNLGVLDLDLSLPAPYLVNYDLVEIDDCIDPEVGGGCVAADGAIDTLVGNLQALVSGVLAPLGYTFSTVVAETAFDLDAKDGEESGLGNLVTDAMRWMVDQVETGETVDVAIESNGVIRDNIKAGTVLNDNIAFSDAFRALPLGTGLDGAVGYPMLSFFLNGADIKKALELIVIAYPLMGGDYWLNVSGLKYQYMPGGIPLFSVTKIEIGDMDSGYVPLDKTALYKVAVNFYVAQFIDGVPALIDDLLGIPGIGNALKIVPRNSSGVPLEDALGEDYLALSRVDADPVAGGIQELKEWKGFMDYLGTFDDTDFNGTPNVPDHYLTLEGRIKPACMVATAAHGSSLEPRTDTLRSFRDRILMKNSVGRKFVDFYYTYGSEVAEVIAPSEWLRALVRIMLLPLVGVAKLALLLV
jgi:5'-nucleotidase